MKALKLAWAIALLLWANYAFALSSPYYGPGCRLGFELRQDYACHEVTIDYEPGYSATVIVKPSPDVGRADPESRETFEARERAYELAARYDYVMDEDQGCGFGEGIGYTDEEYGPYADCLEFVHAEETLSPAVFMAWKHENGYDFEENY